MRFTTIFLSLLFQLVSIGDPPVYAQSIPDERKVVDAAFDTAQSYFEKGSTDTAIQKMRQVIQKAREVDYQKKVAEGHRKVGWYLMAKGKYSEAMKKVIKAEELYNRIQDTAGLGKTYNTIAAIYYYQGKKKPALEYFKKSAEVDSLLGNKGNQASSFNNIGSVYETMGKYYQAIQYYNGAKKLFEEVRDTVGLADVRVNIANAYAQVGEEGKTISYYKQALKVYRTIGYQRKVQVVLNNLGKTYLEVGKVDSASIYLKEGVEVAKKGDGASHLLKNLYGNVSETYRKKDQWEMAFHYKDSSEMIEDTLDKNRMDEKLSDLQVKYETKKKEARLAKQKVRIEEKDFQQRVLWGGVSFLILIVLLVFRNYRIKRKANRQLTEQNHLIEEKNKAITDSINYAQRIQSAILPSTDRVKECLKDHFILYLPKDIVSGDFYWVDEVNGKQFFAAVDCTGHGVPGAMVSVVGANGLERCVREFGYQDPGKILDGLADIVEHNFENSDEEVKDGMDMALCCYDPETGRLLYAGANNALYVVCDRELQDDQEEYSQEKRLIENGGTLREILPDKQPVGKLPHRKPFQTKEVDIQQGDIIYLFSDGYPDQFGGDRGKKFKYKNFKKLLLSIRNEQMTKQKEELEKAFYDWKGEHEQVDDVCVIGVRRRE